MRLMENNGPHLGRLLQPFTMRLSAGHPSQRAVGAHGGQVQMPAVSPGAEEAGPGYVRTPLLCPLPPPAHQVDPPGQSSPTCVLKPPPFCFVSPLPLPLHLFLGMLRQTDPPPPPGPGTADLTWLASSAAHLGFICFSIDLRAVL